MFPEHFSATAHPLAIPTINKTKSYIKVGLLSSKKVHITCFNESSLKMIVMLFISFQKLFSFLRYSNVCHNFFAHMRKELGLIELIFKIYNVKNWEKKQLQ